MIDIRTDGLFLFGFLLLALAFYSLFSVLKAPNFKGKIDGLVGFFSLTLVAIVVVFLGLQSLNRKC
jgi:hypothetical protein